MTDNEFYARLLVTQLAEECHHRNNKRNNTAHCGNDAAIKQDTLRSVLAAKTTVMYKRLTLIGYFKTITTLFKITFLDKMLNSKPPTVWCICGK